MVLGGRGRHRPPYNWINTGSVRTGGRVGPGGRIMNDDLGPRCFKKFLGLMRRTEGDDQGASNLHGIGELDTLQAVRSGQPAGIGFFGPSSSGPSTAAIRTPTVYEPIRMAVEGRVKKYFWFGSRV